MKTHWRLLLDPAEEERIRHNKRQPKSVLAKNKHNVLKKNNVEKMEEQARRLAMEAGGKPNDWQIKPWQTTRR